MTEDRSRSFLKQLTSALSDVRDDLGNGIHYWRHNIRGNKVGKKYFSGDSQYPPVILIQGFMGTRGVLHPLEEYLRSKGRDVISLDFGFFNVNDIRRSSELLSYKVERILDRFKISHPSGKIDIIGHSMGGLIGLHYVKRLGGHRVVRKLVTLGAPYHGSWTALLGILPFGFFSKGIWQMLPTSQFLQSLRARPHEVHQTQVISIAAKFDTLCSPKSCYLEGAVNDVISVGHAGLLMNERVYEALLKHLAEGSADADQAHILPFRKSQK